MAVVVIGSGSSWQLPKTRMLRLLTSYLGAQRNTQVICEGIAQAATQAGKDLFTQYLSQICKVGKDSKMMCDTLERSIEHGM